MKEQENKTKFYMNIFLAGMFILSLVVAWIMAKNLNQDESKVRFKLTKDYKKYKKLDYVYNGDRGKKLYQDLCAKCHKLNGMGTMMVPPLKDSEIVKNHEDKLLKIIVKGLQGPIERQGKSYNSVMPAFSAIPHEDLTHVINYVRKEFGDKSAKDIPTVKTVMAKIDTLTKKGAYSDTEL